MRRTLIALAALSGLVLALAPPVRAEGWTLEDFLTKHDRGAWDGFGPGSMIHTRMTQTLSMPQLPEPQVNVTETRKTLLEETETGYKVKVETKMGDTWTSSEQTVPKEGHREPKVEDAGTGTVTIDGTAYPCSIKKVTWTENDQVVETAVLWVNADHGILKMEVPVAGATSSMETQALDATVTIGDRTVHTRKMAVTTDVGQGPMRTSVWMSDEVPEGMARMETHTEQGPMKMDVVTEVLEILKK